MAVRVERTEEELGEVTRRRATAPPVPAAEEAPVEEMLGTVEQNLFRAEEDATYTVDDQMNLAVGIEYVLRAREAPVSLRLGWHQDKDNRLRADFPDEAGNEFIFSDNDTVPGREDLDHITLGVGAVFGNNFQFDAAVDFSKVTVEAVASFIHRF